MSPIITVIPLTTHHHNLYPPNVSAGGDAGAVGGDNVDATMLHVDVNPLIVNHRRSVITTSAAGANGSGAAGDNVDPILHSLRPQIRHKSSYTHLMNLEGMFRSDDVLELEKVATGLETPTTHDDGDQRKGKGKAKATTGEGNNEGDVDVNINKTLPVPPPATKPVNINL
ncbi:hypothetical protein NP233_g10679 [Leucocoprinus birnbaumii]|uniref:Uncharacterized protein n=1 Tax=Leucocoprinus birnbaumii TaxID=56174 RepID=A0AAD5VIB8_9AGAR|nr:hypothetical protein NP233_g10679 [Leucocoprinus birnbaumii]